MTRTHILAVLVVAAFSFNGTWAQTGNRADAQNRTISVSGEATVLVVPDQVQISMTAENRAADLMAAKEQNDQAVKALVEYATKTLGIEPRRVQTDFITVEPKYRQCNYDNEMSEKCDPLQIIYYTVRKGVQVSLKDVTQYEGLVTKAMSLGVNHIDNIAFTTTELRKYRDEARDMAAKASLEKAQALASALGTKVGKAITINTENYSSYYWHGSYDSQGGGTNMLSQNVIQQAPEAPTEGDTGGLAMGQIKVSATVNVTYQLE
jgi:uncharacterized protein YggE